MLALGNFVPITEAGPQIVGREEGAFASRTQNRFGTRVQRRVRHEKSPRTASATPARAAASVIEKSNKYDDGNRHAEQPEQYSTPHERLLLFDSSLTVAPSKRAGIHFVPAKHTAARDYLRRDPRRRSPTSRLAHREQDYWIVDLGWIERLVETLNHAADCQETFAQFGRATRKALRWKLPVDRWCSQSRTSRLS